MIQRRTPLKRSRKPIPKKRAKPRRGPLRDPGYLEFLRNQRCVACLAQMTQRRLDSMTALMAGLAGIPLNPVNYRCDPAHGPVNGMRSKGPDDGAIPLCRRHHEQQTEVGWREFQKRFDFDWKAMAHIYYASYLWVKK